MLRLTIIRLKVRLVLMSDCTDLNCNYMMSSSFYMHKKTL